MKTCFRCKKLIVEEDNYYSFTEFNQKEIVNVDYAHRKCWDIFLESVGSVEKAQKFLGGINFGSMKDTFRQMGWAKEEEYIIK